MSGSIEVNGTLGSDDGIEVYVNGWRVHEHRIDRGVAPDQERVRIPLAPGRNALVCKVVNTGGVGGFYHREDHDASRIHRDSLALALPERMTDAGARDRARVSWRSTCPAPSPLPAPGTKALPPLPLTAPISSSS